MNKASTTVNLGGKCFIDLNTVNHRTFGKFRLRLFGRRLRSGQRFGITEKRELFTLCFGHFPKRNISIFITLNFVNDCCVRKERTVNGLSLGSWSLHRRSIIDRHNAQLISKTVKLCIVVFIGVDRDNTIGIVDNNRSTEGKCLVFDLVKAFSITLIFQRDRRHIFHRRNILNLRSIAHKLYRLFVLAFMPVDNIIGNGNKVREIKPRQTVLDHILDIIILLRIINLAVKFIGDFEVHKVSRYLNRQLIIGQRGKRKTDIVQIIKISTLTVFRFTEVVDKRLCLVKRSFKGTLKIHDLHRLIGIMFKHCSLQELQECGQLTVRLDLHFIATVIDTADRFAAVKQFTDLITVSDSQFPCAALSFRRLAVSAEELVNDLL